MSESASPRDETAVPSVDAGDLREVLNKLARHVYWQREVLEGQGGRLIAIDANDLVLLHDVGTAQLKILEEGK